MPGYKYQLYNRDGDEAGVYETPAWNWEVGDTLEMARDPKYRIVKIVGLDESDDSSGKYRAAFMVEPAQEVIAHVAAPKVVLPLRRATRAGRAPARRAGVHCAFAWPA